MPKSSDVKSDSRCSAEALRLGRLPAQWVSSHKTRLAGMTSSRNVFAADPALLLRLRILQNPFSHWKLPREVNQIALHKKKRLITFFSGWFKFTGFISLVAKVFT